MCPPSNVCFVIAVLAIIYANRMSTHTKRQVCALTPLEESTRGCSDRPLPWSVENQTWTVHTREETGEHATATGAHATRPLGLSPRSYSGDLDSTLLVSELDLPLLSVFVRLQISLAPPMFSATDTTDMASQAVSESRATHPFSPG